MPGWAQPTMKVASDFRSFRNFGSLDEVNFKLGTESTEFLRLFSVFFVPLW